MTCECNAPVRYSGRSSNGTDVVSITCPKCGAKATVTISMDHPITVTAVVTDGEGRTASATVTPGEGSAAEPSLTHTIGG